MLDVWVYRGSEPQTMLQNLISVMPSAFTLKPSLTLAVTGSLARCHDDWATSSEHACAGVPLWQGTAGLDMLRCF